MDAAIIQPIASYRKKGYEMFHRRLTDMTKALSSAYTFIKRLFVENLVGIPTVLCNPLSNATAVTAAITGGMTNCHDSSEVAIARDCFVPCCGRRPEKSPKFIVK